MECPDPSVGLAVHQVLQGEGVLEVGVGAAAAEAARAAGAVLAAVALSFLVGWVLLVGVGAVAFLGVAAAALLFDAAAALAAAAVAAAAAAAGAVDPGLDLFVLPAAAAGDLVSRNGGTSLHCSVPVSTVVFQVI